MKYWKVIVETEIVVKARDYQDAIDQVDVISLEQENFCQTTNAYELSDDDLKQDHNKQLLPD